MSFNCYIGVNGIARLCRKVYIGDENGKAKIIKKGFIGVNDIARKTFPVYKKTNVDFFRDILQYYNKTSYLAFTVQTGGKYTSVDSFLNDLNNYNYIIVLYYETSINERFELYYGNNIYVYVQNSTWSFTLKDAYMAEFNYRKNQTSATNPNIVFNTQHYTNNSVIDLNQKYYVLGKTKYDYTGTTDYYTQFGSSGDRIFDISNGNINY